MASQEKVTGLLMVSITLSSFGPSILGGTGKNEKDRIYITGIWDIRFTVCFNQCYVIIVVP